ncbi:MAG TPA: cytochrome c family protein [Hyphomicrobiaceae bacterium]|nr:cytochrome c family protein [Hyphomicrobiaceae bacterium]
MDTWEFNKIAGAVLSALLLAFGTGTLIEILASGHAANKPGYELPFKAPTESGTPAAAEKPFSFAEIAPLLKSASADNGEVVFKRCAACHTADKGGPARVGPNLWGVVGRDIGESPSFPRYSAAMKSKEGKWSLESLANYLHDPKGYIPGNQMAFAGVKDNQELADLLAYLNKQSDSPAPLPN